MGNANASQVTEDIPDSDIGVSGLSLAYTQCFIVTAPQVIAVKLLNKVIEIHNILQKRI